MTRWRALAKTYHVSAADIAFVNQIEPTADISGEDALIIPTVPPHASGMQRSSARYRVESEDTLVTLADRFNVTTEQLRRWNHLRSSAIRPGQTLFVAEPAHVSASARGKRGRRGKGRGRNAQHRYAPRTASHHRIQAEDNAAPGMMLQSMRNALRNAIVPRSIRGHA